MVFFLCNFSGDEVVLQICYMSTVCEGLPGHTSVLLLKVFLLEMASVDQWAVT